MLEIRHICCAPHHPETNGKIERFHETLKARTNLVVGGDATRVHQDLAPAMVDAMKRLEMLVGESSFAIVQ